MIEVYFVINPNALEESLNTLFYENRIDVDFNFYTVYLKNRHIPGIKYFKAQYDYCNIWDIKRLSASEVLETIRYSDVEEAYFSVDDMELKRLTLYHPYASEKMYMDFIQECSFKGLEVPENILTTAKRILYAYELKLITLKSCIKLLLTNRS